MYQKARRPDYFCNTRSNTASQTQQTRTYARQTNLHSSTQTDAPNSTPHHHSNKTRPASPSAGGCRCN